MLGLFLPLEAGGLFKGPSSPSSPLLWQEQEDTYGYSSPSKSRLLHEVSTAGVDGTALL